MNERPLESVRDVLKNVGAYLPTLMAGLIVMVLGAVVAWFVSKLTVRLLIFLRIDRVIVRLGWGRALEKGDVRHSLFGLIGTMLGLVIFLVFLDNAIVIWKLTVLSQMLEKFVFMIPQLIVAIIIVSAGWAIANTASRSVQRTLYQEEIGRARLVARIVYGTILIVTCAIALVELELAVTIVTGAFLIVFGALALAFVLAFGLGSRRAIEIFWEQRFRGPKEGAEVKEDAIDKSSSDLT